jgi:hypothetical protein
VPVASIPASDAGEHFSLLGAFVGVDNPTFSFGAARNGLCGRRGQAILRGECCYDAENAVMAAMSLLAGLYPNDALKAYFIRPRCGPQPGMRRVEVADGAYHCWLYENHAWTRGPTLCDRTEALSWWLGDPWLPNHEFAYGVVADGADLALSGQTAGDDRDADWDARRWEEAATALVFHIVTETGARPHDVGPESTETGARVYQRLRTRNAAAQVYWTEGRSRMDDLRGSCPVRTDVAPMLRCAVLAEAAVLLGRRPHVDAYIELDDAPAGVATEAARLLQKFGLPARAYQLLVR